MKKLTRDFNQVTLTRREVFQIELEGVPSAGYLWSVEVREGEGTLLTQRNVMPENNAIGGQVRQVFTFVANRPGTIVIDATYARPWEQTAETTARFVVKVK